MHKVLSRYRSGYLRTLIYMLQSTEYEAAEFLHWYRRVSDFSSVAKRRSLDKTKAARALQFFLTVGVVCQLAVGLFAIWHGIATQNTIWVLLGAIVCIVYPFVWPYLLVLPIVCARLTIVGLRDRRFIKQSEAIFRQHPGQRIAVAGSYGKTTMKELLGTVLAAGLKVAITPDNKNVASSHAMFAKKLHGDEDVLVIEYGEGKPGDVEKFCKTTHPTLGLITGLAPAHLNRYATLDDAGADIFSLANYLKDSPVFVNAESPDTARFMQPGFIAYSRHGVADWKVSNVKLNIHGTEFTLSNRSDSLRLRSGLLGKHQVGPLAASAVIASQLGMTKKQIEEGVANTKPFEHRMQPRHLHDAWIIDDTYNGNIEGIRAGLELLAYLPASRKVYVSPGLVDQGVETARVHKEMGEYIAKAQPDIVYLMRNSVTSYIMGAMERAGFNGEVAIQEDPLEFYTNIDQFVVAGDLVLMQNDWTDNYN